jgi:thioredoxin reductase (NADPH)
VTVTTGELRPVIVTVDDDPSVSRAVARDLRRRYGEGNRIVRAESGADALDALKQMKLRGEQVAVLLADYRMPGMNGIEFLERAMDVYPYAKRVLLTAYADTNAAIDAINIVDLDYYLLKPWDPPEEKLYPPVDELLRAWRRDDRTPMRMTKVIGHRWSAPSSELRDFLARNQVPYRWYASDEAEGQRLLAAAGADGRDLPVLVTSDGEVLVAPSHGEVASKVGLATTPEREFYDLVVIGGGPAGLGAAVYGASEGLRTVLMEKYATGGQAGQSSRIENYLGFPDGLSGGQLTDRARRQAVKFGAELLATREVTGLEVNGSARTVRLADGSAIDAKAVILATGVSYRQLNAPGCLEMTGSGVYYGAALSEAEECKDRDVFVIGGANSAGQAAVYLAKYARSVSMLVRARSLEQSMSYYLIQQIQGIEQITVRTCTEVAEVHVTATWSTSRSVTSTPASPRRSTHSSCSSSSAPRRGPAGSTVCLPATPGDSSSRAWTCQLTTWPAGRSTGRHTTWRPASPACSPRETCGPTPPSGWRPPSGREPWPSCSCTSTWRSCDRARRGVPPVRP